MTTEFALFGLALVAALLCLKLLSEILTRRAKSLISFLQDHAEPLEVDPDFAGYDRTQIIFDRAWVSGRCEVNSVGVSLYSIDRFNVRVPWSQIAAMRLIRMKDKSFVNLRINTDSGIERRLSFQYNKDVSKVAPDSVAIIHG